MKGRYKALAFGLAWFLAGFIVARWAWVDVFADAVPRPPDGAELVALVVGGTLMLVGAVLGLTPWVIWTLRTIYKEDFASGAVCPVMLVCAVCGTYNPRGRRACKECAASLSGARAAGGGPGTIA